MHVVLLHKGCTCMQGPLVTYAVGFALVACVVSPVEVCELWILQTPLLHPSSRPGCQTCFRAFPCHNQWPRVLRRLVLRLQLVHLSPGGLRHLVSTLVGFCTISATIRIPWWLVFHAAVVMVVYTLLLLLCHARGACLTVRCLAIHAATRLQP